MAQVIAMTFAFAWNNFVDPRLATTESVEHYFGAQQLLKRGATVQEFVQMDKKTSFGNLSVGAAGGPCDIALDNKPAVEQLWKHVGPIINSV
eukprot:10774612-Ditylum_brightwellii.AAC.1